MAYDHFLRHTPRDFEALERAIEQERAELQAAEFRDDLLDVLDHAGNLGAMLTSARREREGYAVLASRLEQARRTSDAEPAAWLIHALATSAQYLDRYDEANDLFELAIQRARAHGWRKLEHFVLHHWGRCMVEQARFAQARSCFEQSLAIRESEDDPLQESSRRALSELDKREAAYMVANRPACA